MKLANHTQRRGFMRQWPATFRPPTGVRRAPVRGGRWQVRRTTTAPAERRPWRAWTDGKATVLRRYFPTQKEAFAWAELVAHVYATPEGPEKDVAWDALWRAKSAHPELIVGLTKFPNRPERRPRFTGSALEQGKG